MRVKGKEDIKRDLWGAAQAKCRKTEMRWRDGPGLNEDRQLLPMP